MKRVGQRKKPLQRPWGRGEPGTFDEQEESQGGWSRVLPQVIQTITSTDAHRGQSNPALPTATAHTLPLNYLPEGTNQMFYLLSSTCESMFLTWTTQRKSKEKGTRNTKVRIEVSQAERLPSERRSEGKQGVVLHKLYQTQLHLTLILTSAH